MSKLYMSHTSDNRKEVTRLGYNRMTTHIRGWNKGIKVESFINENNEAEFKVYKTGGSNDPSSKELIHEEI